MWFFKKKEKTPPAIKPVVNEVKEKTLDALNAEYLAYRENEVKQLRKVYNFDSIKGVRAIPVPCHEPNGKESATGRVEYYLRGRCYKEHADAGNYELAAECILKAHALMFVSDMMWGKAAFYDGVNCLRKLGFAELANKEKEKVDQFFDGYEKRLADQQFEDVRKQLKLLKTDLVEVGNVRACCPKCAKYRNRIYSYSGKDKRFPIFPVDFHFECGLRALPFIFGISEPSFECGGNNIAFSNRPFVDDRTQDEIDDYHKRIEIIEKSKRDLELLDKTREDYYWLQRHLPELCPKSVSGYSRMRNSNSATFQKIALAALEKGKKL